MKVPEYIKKAARECGEFNEQARFREREIIEWMENMKITEDTASTPERYMTDSFIDKCQVSNNPEDFIKALENL